MSQSAMNPLIPAVVPAPDHSLSLRVDEALHQEAREYLRAGLQGSANSHRAFTADLRQYGAWCQENSYEPTPLAPVALVESVTFL
jgi:hypothetical protein